MKERFTREKERIAQSLLFHEQPEGIAHGCAMLFKKEQMSKERREQFALGHKKGEKLSKIYETYKFCEQIACYLQAIHSNHAQIIHIALF